MYDRLLESPLKGVHSFFLFGPRGTGKTSWLKMKIPNGLFFDLLNQELFFDLLQNPHRIEEMIPVGEALQALPTLLTF